MPKVKEDLTAKSKFGYRTKIFCISHLVLLNKRLKSLLIIRQAAVETQILLRLSQPLQQDVNSGVKLLRLEPENPDQSVRLTESVHRLYLKCEGVSTTVPDTGPAPAAPAWTPRGCTPFPSECSAPASAL